MFVWIRRHLCSPPSPLGCGAVLLGRWRDSPSPRVGMLQAHIPAMENQPRDSQVLRGAEPRTGNGSPELGGHHQLCRVPVSPAPCPARPCRGGAESCAPRAFPVLPPCAQRVPRGAPRAGAALRGQGSPGGDPSCAPTAPALVGESEPWPAPQGSGLAGLGAGRVWLSRARLGLAGLGVGTCSLQRGRFGPNPSNAPFFIVKILVLWGNPRSVEVSSPRCSPTRTPLPVCGCW